MTETWSEILKGLNMAHYNKKVDAIVYEASPLPEEMSSVELKALALALLDRAGLDIVQLDLVTLCAGDGESWDQGNWTYTRGSVFLQ